MTDVPFDAGDESAVRERKRKAGNAAKADDEVVRALLDHRDGRGWLYRLLKTCHVFASSFTADPLQTAFREGERNIGLQILTRVTAVSPDGYVLMIKENVDA